MPPSEVIYQLLDFDIYPHKRAVNTLDSSNPKRYFCICHVLAQAFVACYLCHFQQAEVLIGHFLLTSLETERVFKKALTLECMGPNFNPQTNHSIAVWMKNCEEMQRSLAW